MSSEDTHTLPMKLVYLVIALVCIMIGFAGLIIPVIPGLLFLFAAVFLLGRVSRRFRRWSETYPVFKSAQIQFEKLKQVDLTAKIKVVGLMSINLLMQSAVTIYRFVRRVTMRK